MLCVLMWLSHTVHKDWVITLRPVNMDDPKSAKEEKDVTKQEKDHKNVVIALILSRTLDLKSFIA